MTLFLCGFFACAALVFFSMYLKEVSDHTETIVGVRALSDRVIELLEQHHRLMVERNRYKSVILKAKMMPEGFFDEDDE